MAALSDRGALALWVSLLTAASTATTLVLACATPFPSLAALAAVHMRRRDGLALMLLAWAASQFIGFFLLGYPRDGSTLAWGVGLGTAAIGSALAGYAALRVAGYRSVAAQLSLAYAAGFTAFKGIILLWALVLGGLHTAMAPDLLVEQFLRNGAILIGLYALYRLLVFVGVPAPPKPAAA
ncbi:MULTISPECIES: hypothetical protein [unclassified Sphingopyxis]|uniref:hypothetical protein n=1 Tax=unclassified Sphingopyxis TaxID=2614943 RepID=UPI000736ACA5|nr:MULTISPECIES: hypothetical protein [unclassified Sphingopyxis]KTE39268.1 hypothetical protein ATE62_09345 [Sphingopyxis sp. HIX]KTE86133.1 hypothetical protein ATE72_00865 [Sphingopyxis sp. HXXIV]